MIGRLNHIAIAVNDLESASALYHGALGAKVSNPTALPDHRRLNKEIAADLRWLAELVRMAARLGVFVEKL